MVRLSLYSILFVLVFSTLVSGASFDFEIIANDSWNIGEQNEVKIKVFDSIDTNKTIDVGFISMDLVANDNFSSFSGVQKRLGKGIYSKEFKITNSTVDLIVLDIRVVRLSEEITKSQEINITEENSKPFGISKKTIAIVFQQFFIFVLDNWFVIVTAVLAFIVFLTFLLILKLASKK